MSYPHDYDGDENDEWLAVHMTGYREGIEEARRVVTKTWPDVMGQWTAAQADAARAMKAEILRKLDGVTA